MQTTTKKTPEGAFLFYGYQYSPLGLIAAVVVALITKAPDEKTQAIFAEATNKEIDD